MLVLNRSEVEELLDLDALLDALAAAHAELSGGKASLVPRIGSRGERGRPGRAHSSDVRAVHHCDRRSVLGIEEDDRRLVTRKIGVAGKHADELAAEAGRGRVPDHRAEDTGGCERTDARHERRRSSGEFRMRGSERIEERVEVEQLLHFAAAQDKHRPPDGTPSAPASDAA